MCPLQTYACNSKEACTAVRLGTNTVQMKRSDCSDFNGITRDQGYQTQRSVEPSENLLLKLV